MSISHLLEIFDQTAITGPLMQTQEEDQTEHELASFERGYKAGWDDCEKAHAQKDGDAEADFQQNLRELSFSYQEAYAAILKSLELVFGRLVNASLPMIAQESLGLRLKELLLEIAKAHAGSAIEIVCNPTQEARIAAILEDDLAMTLRLRSDPALAKGQVDLHFADEEVQIDIDALTAEIKNTVDTFFADLCKETAFV